MRPLLTLLAALLLIPLAARTADADPAFIHLKTFGLPPEREKLVLTTAGIVQLGERLARGYLERGSSPTTP